MAGQKARKKFQGYRDGLSKRVRAADVKLSRIDKELDDRYEKALWLGKEFGFFPGSIDASNDDISLISLGFATIYDLDYTERDIQKFLIRKSGIEEEGYLLGGFVSSLIENLHMKKTKITLMDKIHCLGTVNSQKLWITGDVGNGLGNSMQYGMIVVDGNAGRYLGDKMKGGAIIVKGNAGGGAGHEMKAGIIIIEGNAGDALGEGNKDGHILVRGNAGDYLAGAANGRGCITVLGNAEDKVGQDGDVANIHIFGNVGDNLGLGMRGGVITVEGNAGKLVGDKMHDGAIEIGGDFESIGDVKQGQIYHKGKLVFTKGVP